MMQKIQIAIILGVLFCLHAHAHALQVQWADAAGGTVPGTSINYSIATTADSTESIAAGSTYDGDHSWDAGGTLLHKQGYLWSAWFLFDEPVPANTLTFTVQDLDTPTAVVTLELYGDADTQDFEIDPGFESPDKPDFEYDPTTGRLTPPTGTINNYSQVVGISEDMVESIRLYISGIDGTDYTAASFGFIPAVTEPDIYVYDGSGQTDDLLINFPFTTPGTSSSPVTVMISNIGNAPLNVSDISITGQDHAEFDLDLNVGISPCGSTSFVLDQNTECTLAVAFSPATVGLMEAGLEIASDDPDEAIVTVSLNGVSEADPDISVSHTENNFNNVLLLDTASLEITIYNIGNADLTVSDISLATGDHYSVDASGGTNPCGNPDIIINQGANCTALIIFSPQSEGTFTDTLTITSDDPGEPTRAISLTGNGAKTLPDISVSPSEINITLNTGERSDTKPVTITNLGSDDLTVDDISFVNGIKYFSLHINQPGWLEYCNTLPRIIASSSKCRFIVSFIPEKGVSIGTIAFLIFSISGILLWWVIRR